MNWKVKFNHWKQSTHAQVRWSEAYHPEEKQHYCTLTIGHFESVIQSGNTKSAAKEKSCEEFFRRRNRPTPEHFKTTLNNWKQRHRDQTIEWSFAYDPTFKTHIVLCRIGCNVRVGAGPSKKDAEEEAAKALVQSVPYYFNS